MTTYLVTLNLGSCFVRLLAKVKVHLSLFTPRTRMGRGGVAPLISNLSAGWRWVVSM